MLYPLLNFDKMAFFGRHNFFIFQRQELPLDGAAYEFLCQTTSMDFLAKYQFDFNACIHEGTSFYLLLYSQAALSNRSCNCNLVIDVNACIRIMGIFKC